MTTRAAQQILDEMVTDTPLPDVIEALDDAVDRYIRIVSEVAPLELARECAAALPKLAALRATIRAFAL